MPLHSELRVALGDSAVGNGWSRAPGDQAWDPKSRTRCVCPEALLSLVEKRPGQTLRFVFPLEDSWSFAQQPPLQLLGAHHCVQPRPRAGRVECLAQTGRAALAGTYCPRISRASIDIAAGSRRINLLGCIFCGISAVAGHLVPSIGELIKLVAANWNTGWERMLPGVRASDDADRRHPQVVAVAAPARA